MKGRPVRAAITTRFGSVFIGVTWYQMVNATSEGSTRYFSQSRAKKVSRSKVTDGNCESITQYITADRKLEKGGKRQFQQYVGVIFVDGDVTSWGI